MVNFLMVGFFVLVCLFVYFWICLFLRIRKIIKNKNLIIISNSADIFVDDTIIAQTVVSHKEQKVIQKTKEMVSELSALVEVIEQNKRC